MSDARNEAVAARVQRVDPARTLAAKLAPKQEADRLIGLYAFNYEIARVAESVSEPTLGEIRLQWWREAIDEMRTGKKVRAHDAAQALERAVVPTYPFDLLEALVDARERDLDAAPFESVDSLSTYADATAGALTLAAAHLLAASPITANVRTGLLNAGRAWGLAGLAREKAIAVQFNARPRLPITPTAEEIANAARAAHGQARAELRGAPPNLLPAYAYVALVPNLTRSFNVQAAAPLGMRWRILRTALTGSI